MNRIAHFDYTRTIAILCVIVSHTALAYTFRPREILIDTFIHNLVGVGVPLFFFMAGYFVNIKPGQTFAGFMQKKITRIYIPGVLWTVVFAVVFSLFGRQTELDLQQLLIHVIFLTDPPFYYFIFVIMQFFAIGYFFFGFSTKTLKKAVLICFLLNLITIGCYELMLWTATDSIKLPGDVMYRMPLAWVFFFVYGIYIARTDHNLAEGWFLRFRQNRVLGISIMLLLLIVTWLESLALYPYSLPGAQDYFKLASFLFEILALHYTLIWLKDFHPTQVVDTGLKIIARYSFFIYLVHMPTAEKILGTDRLMALSHMHYVAVLLVAALCLVIPLTAVYIIRIFSFIPAIGIGARYIGIPSIRQERPGSFRSLESNAPQ